jgi:hypothetical protein
MNKWILITAILMLTGCGATYPDPSGTVDTEHQQSVSDVEDSVLPPKFNLGDVVSVGDETPIGIIISCQRQMVLDEYFWIYSVLFHNKTIRYTEDKIVLVEKFDWNRPSKQGIVD